MRFVEVSAQNFGPFRDRKLTFADGFNIVFGENASGKSSWHAALYLAFCGMKRGRGKRADEKDLEAKHRPWDDETDWKVSTVIKLDSGRTIEIRQDLDGKIDCQAMDIDLGRDVATEIINEGAPDGARFLGLDRRSFQVTALVRQAQILSVTNDPAALQEQLQLAAASAGIDETTAAALRRIEEFISENIGLDRANSTKPLRATKVQLREAKGKADEAHVIHREFLTRIEQLDDLKTHADASEHEYNLMNAFRALRDARAARDDYERARLLSEKYKERPTQIADEGVLAQDVAAALEGWEKRPPARFLDGDSAAKLQEMLIAIPPLEDGDQEPDPSVLKARDRFQQGRAAAQLHEQDAPADVIESDVIDERAPRRMALRRIIGSILSLTLSTAGILLVVRNHTLAGLTIIAAALLAFGLVLVSFVRASAHEKSLLVNAEVARQQHADWERRRALLRSSLLAAEAEFKAQLLARCIDGDLTVEELFERYNHDCVRRAGLARASARKSDLKAQLVARMAAEEAFTEAELRRAEATALLRDVSRRCNLDTESDESSASELKLWQQRHARKASEADEALREWGELQALLKGQPLEALRQRGDQKEAYAKQLASRLRDVDIPDKMPIDNLDETVERLRLKAVKERSEAEQLGGRVEELSENLADVAQLDENASRLDEELQRITDLGTTLERTRAFLEEAQLKVHRNVARILASALHQHLPQITRGKYTEAIVDPQSLEVRVRSGSRPWRKAALLSLGTAEQVYLLLRIAMADHLTKASRETCPLILDDATTQFDATRTAAVLRLLQDMSRDRQIIFFTQQTDVLNWARENFGPHDKLQELDASLIGA